MLMLFLSVTLSGGMTPSYEVEGMTEDVMQSLFRRTIQNVPSTEPGSETQSIEEEGPDEPGTFYRPIIYSSAGDQISVEERASRSVDQHDGSDGGIETALMASNSDAFLNLGDNTGCRGQHGFHQEGIEYVVVSEVSLERCQFRCSDYGDVCKGIQFTTPAYNRPARCEIWIREIVTVVNTQGTTCYAKPSVPFFRQPANTACRGVGGDNDQGAWSFANLRDFSNEATCLLLCINMEKKCFGIEYASERCELHLREIVLTRELQGHRCIVKGLSTR
eukprot:gb/GEZN01012184.1/.p1 GENE.gb/GEZN01012184.1/~~gb/GEZN01012184.1/.p1  ORF type:complete len:308 (-),score=13.53 gb/GEZN01012184.1/:177-1004(-)